MLEPIFFENDKLLIHPLRPQDLKQFDQLAKDIFYILSDEHTLKYLPEKRLSSLEQAEAYLRTIILNYHAGRSFVHFITDKSQNRVIGIIELISPEVAREFYSIPSYPFFIEFFLQSKASGCYLMTEILPVVIDSIQQQGISEIGAVVNRKNTAAKRVLEKANFVFSTRFDREQDMYQVMV